MIDAFRKDFSRLQRGRLTDRRTDGRNSAGIDSALKRFLFFESTRTRGEEVIKNLSRIWRPFFFIGVLHFPRCTTIFHRWYRFPTPSLLHFSHRYFLPRFLYPSIFSLLSARASFFLSFSRRNSSGSGLFEEFLRDVPHIFSQRFPFHEKNTTRRRSEGKLRTLTIIMKFDRELSYYSIYYHGNGSFRILMKCVLFRR